MAQAGALEIKLSTKRYSIIVPTQGQDTLQALSASINATNGLVAFVGNQKNQALATKLVQRGAPEERVRAVQASAGLDISAERPEKIALSIFAARLSEESLAMIKAKKLNVRSLVHQKDDCQISAKFSLKVE